MVRGQEIFGVTIKEPLAEHGMYRFLDLFGIGGSGILGELVVVGGVIQLTVDLLYVVNSAEHHYYRTFVSKLDDDILPEVLMGFSLCWREVVSCLDVGLKSLVSSLWWHPRTRRVEQTLVTTTPCFLIQEKLL